MTTSYERVAAARSDDGAHVGGAARHEPARAPRDERRGDDASSYDMYMPGQATQRYGDVRSVRTTRPSDGTELASSPRDDDDDDGDASSPGAARALLDVGDDAALPDASQSSYAVPVRTNEQGSRERNASSSKDAKGDASARDPWQYARYVVYFIAASVLTFALLMVINPPFVQQAARVDATRERVPAHIGKAIGFSVLAGTIATLVPLAWTHLRPVCADAIQSFNANANGSASRTRDRNGRSRKRRTKRDRT